MRGTLTTIAIGTLLWIIALAVEIARNAPTDALWICVVGALFGSVGFIYSFRRLRREAKAKN